MDESTFTGGEQKLVEWHEHLCRLTTDSRVRVKSKAQGEPATATASVPEIYPGNTNTLQSFKICWTWLWYKRVTWKLSKCSVCQGHKCTLTVLSSLTLGPILTPQHMAPLQTHPGPHQRHQIWTHAQPCPLADALLLTEHLGLTSGTWLITLHLSDDHQPALLVPDSGPASLGWGHCGLLDGLVLVILLPPGDCSSSEQVFSLIKLEIARRKNITP